MAWNLRRMSVASLRADTSSGLLSISVFTMSYAIRSLILSLATRMFHTSMPSTGLSMPG